MTIKINIIIEDICILYNLNNEKIGVISSHLQLLDVRCQIKEQNQEGYYVLWQNKKSNQIERFDIQKNGNMYMNPGFFNKEHKFLEKLLDWK
jgi:hypothetical protein